MAADRAKTTLMIALIIFVMIAFILSVTTYLGFQQKAKERLAADKAKADLVKANEDRAAAEKAFQTVRAVLGTDKDTADAVELERDELFGRKFADFNKDPKSLLRLVEWLADAIKTKDNLLAAANKELEQEKDKVKAAESDRDRIKLEAKTAQEAADEKVRKVSEDFAARWAQHEQAQSEMKAKQDVALGESERMRLLTEEVAKLGDLLSDKRKQQFAAPAPEGQPDPWTKRLELVRQELQERAKAIKLFNQAAAELRVADSKLQEKIRDWTPSDDRIDGFDGRISSVNSLDRTVLVVCDSTGGMRPGLRMSVFESDDPRPRIGTRKGLIEVVEVEGPTLARARILGDAATNPILSGDGVATSLWAPGASPQIALVGYVRFGAGRKQDADSLAAAVERSGAKIVDTVSPTTTLVVDAGEPSSMKDWRPADATARKAAIKRAEESGIRVVPLEELLDMLGLDHESINGRRLPWPAGASP